MHAVEAELLVLLDLSARRRSFGLGAKRIAPAEMFQGPKVDEADFGRIWCLRVYIGWFEV